MGQSQKLHNSPNGTTIEGVVLDVNYLNHATFGDKALRVEILGLFRAQLDGLVKNIMLPMDAQGWLFLTHTLGCCCRRRCATHCPFGRAVGANAAHHNQLKPVQPLSYN